MIEIANAIRTHRVFITKKNKYVNLTISILISKSIHSNYRFKYLPQFSPFFRTILNYPSSLYDGNSCVV